MVRYTMVMKVNSWEIQVHQYEDFADLEDPIERELCQRSLLAQKDAYAPYSRFNVGAAILMSNGNIVTGSNQENAVFPLSLCAERVAVFSANNLFPDDTIEKIAISTSTKSNDIAFPCGSCRQVLMEEELKIEKPIKLLILGQTGQVIVVESTKDLLPFSFNAGFLK